MQKNLNLELLKPTAKSWAFAAEIRRSHQRSVARAHRNLNRYIITACSPEAKLFGIRAGMRYQEAKRLVPDIKILAIGNRSI